MSDTINLDMLLAMKHSPVRNYVIPGLTSWLIGAPSPKGCIRLFECEREHQEAITPHSHRFDFQCWVLAGWVTNRIWGECVFKEREADWYIASQQTKGRMGGYEVSASTRRPYKYRDATYGPGQWYSMKADQIHSIYFGRGTKVLFFEGPEVTDATTILEPYANDEHVRTFKVEPWMFQRCDSQGEQ